MGASILRHQGRQGKTDDEKNRWQCLFLLKA